MESGRDVTGESLHLSAEGAGAVLVDAHPLPSGTGFSEAVQARMLALAVALKREAGVSETVPGMNNLMVVFDPLALDPARLEIRIRSLYDSVVPDEAARRRITVPVRYGGAGGEDLVALAAEKNISPAELVALHTAPVYRVAAVGAMPGFVYLSGLDPRLATPRRAVPRMAVPVGSVIIGGAQAGIMPLTAPSGWHILGVTPLSLFDPLRMPPALFAPGDEIRFEAVEVEA